MTTALLREHTEKAVAMGQLITVRAEDLLALLIALDLRERLDPDVEICARFSRDQVTTYDYSKSIADAAERVLKHEPKPDMAGVPS